MGRFRMYGRIVQLNRWRVDYEMDGESMSEFFPNEEEANAAVQRTNGTKIAIDVTGDEWIDGMEVSDVPQPMAEALRIYSEGQAGLIRQRRNALLAETDWTQLSDAPFTEEEQLAIRAYRQSLRDIPQQENFPETSVFPQVPSALMQEAGNE